MAFPWCVIVHAVSDAPIEQTTGCTLCTRAVEVYRSWAEGRPEQELHWVSCRRVPALLEAEPLLMLISALAKVFEIRGLWLTCYIAGQFMDRRQVFSMREGYLLV